jgi:hypothetical protein
MERFWEIAGWARLRLLVETCHQKTRLEENQKKTRLEGLKLLEATEVLRTDRNQVLVWFEASISDRSLQNR